LQRNLGIGLAVGELLGACDRLFVQFAPFADEFGPFPKRRVGGQLFEAGEVLATLLVFRWSSTKKHPPHRQETAPIPRPMNTESAQRLSQTLLTYPQR
jgi:hypothetical protein